MVNNPVQLVLAPLFLPTLKRQALFEFNLCVDLLIVHSPLAEVEPFDVDHETLWQRPDLRLLLHIRLLLTCGTVEPLTIRQQLRCEELRQTLVDTLVVLATSASIGRRLGRYFFDDWD